MRAEEEDSPLNDYVVTTIPDRTDCLYAHKKLLPRLMKYKAHIVVVLLLVIFGLIAALITVTTQNELTETKGKKSASCEYDWIWSRGKCYYFSTKDDTWHNSQRFCESHNASLALIDNKEELKFLYRYTGEENHWIGLRRREDNKAWTWINGTLYDESLFNITRTSHEAIEYVLLNHKEVKSELSFKNKWICNKI